MADKSSSWFDRWIFDSYQASAEGLGLFRVFTALFLLLFMLPSRSMYAFVGALPDDFFSPPPGPMMFFSGFPSESVLLLLHYLLILALVGLLLGLGTRHMSVAAGLLLLIIEGFLYSVGKINHNLLLAVVPLVMAFSGWGQAYALDTLRKSHRKVPPQSWTLTLLALIIGFMFFTAGFPKILGGWLNIETHAAQGHFFKHYFIRGRQDLLAHFALNVGPWVWELFDYATVLFEVSFLAAIWHPRSSRIFICFAVLFHFSTMLVLNISFLPNFLAFAAFLNWPWINKIIKKGAGWFSLESTERQLLPPLLIAAGMFLIGTVIPLSEASPYLQSDLTLKEVVWVGLAVPIALYYLFKQLVIRIRSG